SDQERGRQGDGDRQQEGTEVQGQGRAEECADHVQSAVGKVDEVHDAEDERQPGRHQEQQHAELNSVQQLDQYQAAVHTRPPGSASRAARARGPAGPLGNIASNAYILHVPTCRSWWFSITVSTVLTVHTPASSTTTSRR